MVTDTGGDWCSAGPRAPPGPILPAADAAGTGACCCASAATRIAMAPPRTREIPVSPASRTRARPRGGGWGANWLSGQDMTTRSPAMRGWPPIWRTFPIACAVRYGSPVNNPIRAGLAPYGGLAQAEPRQAGFSHYLLASMVDARWWGNALAE